MDEPRRYLVLVSVQGYPESSEALAQRIARTLQTHPTLSLVVDSVSAREVSRVEAAIEQEKALADLLSRVTWTD